MKVIDLPEAITPLSSNWRANSAIFLDSRKLHGFVEELPIAIADHLLFFTLLLYY
jgi:hypothetical protein